MDEALVAHMADQFQHRIPEAVDVGEDHRFFVPAELRPGHDLDDLLKRPDPTRQGDEGVGAFEHGVLALMHVTGDDQLVQLPERMARRFHVDEKFGDDAGHLAAV